MPEPKSSPRRINVAERRAAALRLRAGGLKLDEILARHPELGYKSRAALSQDLQRAMIETVRQPADEVRALELERLDMLWREAMRVLTARHISVSNGRVVTREDPITGEEHPVPDDDPVLRSIDRLLKIMERRSKLLGLDAPAKVEVITLDSIEAELRRLEDEEAEQAAILRAENLGGTEGPEASGVT